MGRFLKIRCRIWLEDGEPVFGDGMASLLSAIDRTGSINQAAGSLKMSYRQAWGRIRKAEERLGMSLIETRVGGESGGGTAITQEGRELLLKYRTLRKRIDESINEIFRDVFKDAFGGT